MLLWGLLLLGCSEDGPSDPEVACPTEPPSSGEVRARRITCTSDIPGNGEAGIGDWIIENSHVRLTIRNTPNRLTQLGGAGGTVIDAALWHGDDALVEIVPHVTGDWPEHLSISVDGEAIELQAEDGSDRLWRYHLQPASAALQLENATGFTVVPSTGSQLDDQILQTPSGLNIASPQPPEDAGGWVHWTDTDTLYLGAVSEVVAAVYDDVTPAQGSTDASSIEVGSEESTIFVVPVEDGEFEFLAPSSAAIRATASGHTPSAWVPPSTAMNLSLGEAGFLVLTVLDEAEQPIASNLHWNDLRYSLLDEPTAIGIGPGLGAGWIDAGPEYRPHIIDEVTIAGEMPLTVVLERVAPAAAQVAFGVRAFPDPIERRPISHLLWGLAAEGVDYAILTATDEVAQASTTASTEHLISVSAASRSGGPHGAPIAWPWSADGDEAAHGAVDWLGQTPVDLLALMSKAGRRNTAVDAEWVATAGPATAWDPLPRFIHINGPEDRATVARVLDQWVPVGILGDRTWVHVDGRSKVEIQRGLFEAKTTASSGPQLHFSVDDLAPGGALELTEPALASVDLSNPGDVDEVYLLGPGAEVIGSWPVASLPIEVEIAPTAWVLAVAEGNTSWAMTSPIWLGRP